MSNEARETVLDLRAVFGIEARITTPAEATGGEYVEMDCTLDPDAGSIIHYHLEQEETYQVVDGTLEVFRDDRWRRERCTGSGTRVGRPPGSSTCIALLLPSRSI
ncbi:MAG: hypothetical protein ACRDSJ_03870 [Rubrobacteraceae bacterium]